jgi:hypothetical protein
MRQWARARHVMQCGFCGKPIRKGDPVLFLATLGVERKLKRCVDCTNDPVPDKLPDAPIEEPTTTPSRQSSFLPLGALARDWRIKQAGGDE